MAHADTRQERALRIAESVFHWSPCNGRIDIDYGRLRPTAEVSKAWAWPDECLIEFHNLPEFMPWAVMCDTILHEAGHLAGIREHSENPRSVMHADALIAIDTSGGRYQARGADHRCYDRGRRYLGMRPAGFGWR